MKFDEKFPESLEKASTAISLAMPNTYTVFPMPDEGLVCKPKHGLFQKPCCVCDEKTRWFEYKRNNPYGGLPVCSEECIEELKESPSLFMSKYQHKHGYIR